MREIQRPRMFPECANCQVASQQIIRQDGGPVECQRAGLWGNRIEMYQPASPSAVEVATQTRDLVLKLQATGLADGGEMSALIELDPWVDVTDICPGKRKK